MKAVQITIDDRLLARLDADPEAYLSRMRRRTITDAYHQAYGTPPASDDEFEGWEDEGVWPEP
jgi:antitoxin component of MazEF toxin-antitoxin module